MNNFTTFNKNNLYNRFVICPYCGSEAWEITKETMQCFLCKASFSPKELFTKRNVFSINKNLKFLKDNDESTL